MSHWPELGEKQLQSYAEDGFDWRDVAKEHVFPFLVGRLPAMAVARRCLLASFEPLYARARANLGLDFGILYLIYVGIGCGAGWATSFAGQPACLFGLENLAELGWTESEAIEGLVAHEMGHLLFSEWRRRRSLEAGRSPCWQLYEEGFAARCQHLILGRETWHQAVGQRDWLSWCQENRAWLATEFLRRAGQGETIAPFFGTWYDLRGWRECGHYLGCELIRAWRDELGLEGIAVLPCEEAEHRTKETLLKLGGLRVI
jgi:hypothetical protein